MGKTTSNSEKIVSLSFVETILHKLYDWMPFKRNNGGIIQDSTDENGEQTLKTTNENEIALGRYNKTDVHTLLSIGIGSRNSRKNAVMIQNDGEIFLITNLKTKSIESLQQTLDKKGVSFCYTIEELEQYKTKEYLGKLLYFDNISDKYDTGLYIVSLDSKTGNSILFKIGTSVEQDLSNYYTKEEVNKLIDAINAGDVDLANYYTIKQIDDKLNPIIADINDITNWIDNPITEIELNEILQKI